MQRVRSPVAFVGSILSPLLILNIWVYAMCLNLIIANEINLSINQFIFKWVNVLMTITTPIKDSTLKPIYPRGLWMLHQIARPRHYRWKVHSVLQQYPVQDPCLKPIIDAMYCPISLVSSAWSLFMWDAKKSEILDQIILSPYTFPEWKQHEKVDFPLV